VTPIIFHLWSSSLSIRPPPSILHPSFFSSDLASTPPAPLTVCPPPVAEAAPPTPRRTSSLSTRRRSTATLPRSFYSQICRRNLPLPPKNLNPNFYTTTTLPPLILNRHRLTPPMRSLASPPVTCHGRTSISPPPVGLKHREQGGRPYSENLATSSRFCYSLADGGCAKDLNLTGTARPAPR
jgi:hypothetical protein